MPERPWRDDRVTIACPRRGPAFVAVGRQRYCSAACRQAGWRQRQPTPLPPLPARAPRLVTVYACPACDARYLGEQRGPKCHLFGRRVGPGGRCPHCDEPGALADLLVPVGRPTGQSRD